MILIASLIPRPILTLLFLGVGLGTLGTGCGGDTSVIAGEPSDTTSGGGPTVTPGPVETVSVTPGTLALTIGATAQLTAQAKDAKGLIVSGTSPVWSTSDAQVVTVDNAGALRAVAAGAATVTATAAGKNGAASISVQPIPAGAVIVLDAGTRYQTMSGWEVIAQAGQGLPNYSVFRDGLLDRAVNELGINRIRLGLASVAENPTDWFTLNKTGQITDAEFRCLRNSSVQDNSDPFSINPAGFQFSGLDDAMDHVVVPVRQRLQARGEELYLNVNYVAFKNRSTCPSPATVVHRNAPEEYAELMLATFQHLQSKYGFVPDAIEMLLEPENTVWWSGGGRDLGDAMVATSNRLRAAGFAQVEFIAPSTTGAGNAVPFLNDMLRAPGAAQLVSEVSYHRYRETTNSILQGIVSAAGQLGARTSMLEFLRADHHDLYQDLTVGNVSAFQQFALAFFYTGSQPPNDNSSHYWIANNGGPPTITMDESTRYLRQYYRWVRRDDVRIGATSANSAFLPVAFAAPSGRTTVVVKASTGGSFPIAGLPAGSYGINYTTDQEFDVDQTVQVAAGQLLNASIPRAGVLTVYAR